MVYQGWFGPTIYKRDTGKKMKSKYPFPKANPSPFDRNFNGNYFVMADGYSNLSKNLNDFNFDSLDSNIPKGYKTIIVCKRIMIIGGDGKLQFSMVDKDRKPKFLISSNIKHPHFAHDWNREVSSLVIYKPNSRDASFKSSIWHSFGEAVEFGSKLANETRCELIISQVIDAINWH